MEPSELLPRLVAVLAADAVNRRARSSGASHFYDKLLPDWERAGLP